MNLSVALKRFFFPALLLLSSPSWSQTCSTGILDERVAEFMKKSGSGKTMGELAKTSVETIRKGGPSHYTRLHDDSVTRVQIGAQKIRMNVVNASGGKDLPVIINFHPGEFILPLQPWMEYEAMRLSRRFNAVVFDVDYRVAPEHKFPAAADDAWQAYLWVLEHAGEYGGDPSTVILNGSGGGATLAALTAHRAKREDKLSPIKSVFMVCPVVDNPMISYYPSQDEYATGYFFSRDEALFALEQYLDKPEWYHNNPRIWPIYEQDLSGLPQTLIITTEFDIFRDEGIAYGKKLEAAGVRTSIKCFPHQIHNFIGLPGDAAEIQRVHELMAEAISAIPVE